MIEVKKAAQTCKGPRRTHLPAVKHRKHCICKFIAVATICVLALAALGMVLTAGSVSNTVSAQTAPISQGFGETFGINSTLIMVNHTEDQIDHEFDAMSRAGIKWLRAPLNWSYIEEQRGAWNFAMPDYVVQKAQASGINILGILGGAPLWANGNQAWYPPTDLAAWRDYVETVVRRYPSIKAWEIWNEENIGFWLPGPDPAAYMNLLKITYPLIKSINPSSKVLMGGLAGSGGDYLKQCLSLGLADYTDAINYHPYPDMWSWMNPMPQESTAREVLAATKALFKQYTNKNLEVWLTEVGWATAGIPANVPEETQADYWVRTALNYADAGVDKVFYYDLWEMAPPAEWLSNAFAVNHMGILHYDFSEKPSFHYYQTMQSLMSRVNAPAHDAARFSCSSPSSLETHCFNMDDGSLLICAWKSDDRSDSLTINLNSPLFKEPVLVDPVTGQERPAQEVSIGLEQKLTVANLAVGMQPVFLKFAPLSEPSVSFISPSSATAGCSDTPITLTGSNFVPKSVINWSGTALATTYGSSTSLSATIPRGDIAKAGTYPVTVTNPEPGGGASNPVDFTVNGNTKVASSSFYFAEGYTGSNFAEYLCMGNPSSSDATAKVTYLFTDGSWKDVNYKVPANSRYTVNVNSTVGVGREVSIRVLSDTPNLVAERPIYFNYKGVWTGGSDAVGATAPNTSWYFAEGNTLPNFDEYVTVLNPGSTTANLTFHYMVEGAGGKDVTGSVGAHSRATFNTRSQIGDGKNASLYLSSNQAVVAERPMYFNYQGLASNNWTGGHDVVGTNSPQKQWYLAEGTTRGGFEEWLCMENPGSSPITVNATYQLGTGQGASISNSYIVPAKQRLTVSVNKEIGTNKDNSVALTSAGTFIAERPMYFNYNGVWTGSSDVLGANGSAKTWYFAEGATRDNFNEWLTLQNPGSADAHATITYDMSSGQAIPKNWIVPANSRLTVNVNVDAGANQDISAKVSSDNPIIAERPMYFDYNGWTGGHDVVGFVPSPQPPEFSQQRP